MAGFERKVHSLLKQNGYSPERNPRGSHVIWSNGVIQVTVPAKIRKRHTANGILKAAGIKAKL